MTRWKELPYDITNVTPDEDRIIKKCLKGYTKTFVKCGKKGYVMPGAFEKHAEAIYNMEVRSDDVWVITFPRSGTTWTQEMVWLLKNNLDFKVAKDTPLHERFPMLEISCHVPDIAFELIKVNFMGLGCFQGLNKAVRCHSWKSIENEPSPRFIKTHLPLSLLPPDLLKTAKVIYVARDPRDVAVSYYYLHKMVYKSFMRVSFSKFWDAFRKDLLPWCPVVSHAQEAWEQRRNPNLHFLFYEDLIKDLPKEIAAVTKFLGQQYSTDQIKNLAQHLSFDSLRKNKNVNNTTIGNNEVQFIRKGEAGGWKEHFDTKMMIQAEDYLISRTKDLDLVYPSFPVESETSYL